MSEYAEADLSPPRVAVVGVGQVAEHYVCALTQMGADVRVIGAAHINESCAVEFAAACGVRTATDYRELLRSALVIAVICLSHHLHREAGQTAVSDGSYVVVKKPLANTLEDSHPIADSCRQRGIFLSVGFVHRYCKGSQRVKELIASDQIGRLLHSDSQLLRTGRNPCARLNLEEASGGSSVLMHGDIRSVARLRWLLDSEVEEVFARTTSYSQEVDAYNSLVAILALPKGCLATPRGSDIGTRGSRARVRGRTRQFKSSGDSRAYRLDATRDDTCATQAKGLVSAIREHQDSWATGEDSL